MIQATDAVGAQGASVRVDQILDVAGFLFAQKGYDGTSMREIAEACDISKALLYHHFSGKQDIHTRVIVGSGERLLVEVERHVAAASGPAERLRAFMVGAASFFDENRSAWSVSSSTFWNHGDHVARSEQLAQRDRFEQLLRAIIADGIEQGVLRGDLDAAMAGRLVLSSINWMHRWYDPAKAMRAGEIADTYYDMIFSGIRNG